VELQVRQGGFVSLLGPSGCGKSTLLKVLAGLVNPEQGSAAVSGMDVRGRTGQVAYMPQRDLLLPWRRAMANATLGAEVDGVPADAARARAGELFERFGLAGFEEAWPTELSGGMRQRLALLRTFLIERDVVLLDEPFGALDAITRREMYEWLAEVWQADARTVLFVTHDIDEAIFLSDRVVVLSGRPGQVVADLTIDLPRPRPSDVLTNPVFLARRAELLDALH
jgi:ABC-type nitrate/sulfonate/bicarbonate transport system ATPase subunit